jgi:asparagine synthase (glutamine-hydrolysing)
VTAAASARLDPGELKTFTIGFTEPSFDESSYARQVATHFGTDHRQRILDLDIMKKLVPGVLNRLDEPLGDASIMPTYFLSAFARENVTVALSGDGGDELFAGYDPFKALKPAQWYNQLVPAPLHKGLRRLADFMPKSHRNMSLDFKIRRVLMGLSYPQSIWVPVWMSPLEPDALQDLFEEPIHMEDLFQDIIELWESGDQANPVDRTLEFYTNYYLQDDILMKSDRAAMMSSLETRAIFLDNDLTDFCRRLPAHFKYRNGERKYLLKKAFADTLPETIINRHKKGFGIPLSKWLQSMSETSSSEPISCLHPEFAETAWADHRSGTTDHRLFLWSWLSLQHVLGNRPSLAL